MSADRSTGASGRPRRRPSQVDPTMVPTPSSVKSSSSSACGVRPSRMWARRTPWRTARAHASTLGIIPPVAAPDGHHGVELLRRHPVQQRGRVVGIGPQTGHVGEEDQLLGLERRGQGPGRPRRR